MAFDFRLLVTGAVHQRLFRRRLTGRQWVALLLITAGCLVQKMGLSNSEEEEEEEASGSPTKGGLSTSRAELGLMLVAIQVCVCV